MRKLYSCFVLMGLFFGLVGCLGNDYFIDTTIVSAEELSVTMPTFTAESGYTVSDLSSLKNYLLGVSEDTSLETVDINNDEKLDVWDVVSMKRDLIEGTTHVPPIAVPDNMPAIVDDYGEVTDTMKTMLWQSLSQSYPDMDFGDFTLVYDPQHPLGYFGGHYFYIYFKDILAHGYANINLEGNVYAVIERNGAVRFEFLVNPENYYEVDLNAPRITSEELERIVQHNGREIELVIFSYSLYGVETPKLAYKVVTPAGDAEDIVDAITGEILESIPYFVV